MADKYVSFADLAASESKASYAITLRDQGSSVAVIAAHGGCIEPGTSEIARAIAGDEYSLYLFEGLKSRRNGDLHITSTNFDEPTCKALLRSTMTVVTIHGERSPSEIIYLGGCHERAIAALRTDLELSGFRVREHSKPSLRGLDKRNLCNKGTCDAGVQMELSRGLRESFFQSLTRTGRVKAKPSLFHFSASVRRALSQTGL